MKVVVAYSGGLDTSVIVKWVKETYNAEVICFCADVGQEEETFGLEEKAIKTGASKCYVENLTEEFARDFIFPMMQANAIYEGTYLLGTSIARPLIGKRLVEIARAEGADAICHGATGKGNDQVRFELAAYAMQPGIKIIAAWRDPQWHFKSRTEMIKYANEHNIPITSTAAKPYSMDRNLLHISFEGGILEDPWEAPPEDLAVMTKPLSQASDIPEDITVTFEQGIPVAVNGEQLSPASLMRKLNTIGAKHAVGRIDIVENRFVGMKSRGVYETPGGTILHHAHRALESITMDKEVMYLRDSFIPQYSRMVYNGFWFAPEREMLQTAITKSQEFVTGDVRLKLFKGNCYVTGRRSEYSLYDHEIASFEAEDVYNQKDAEGFIRLQSLRLRMMANSKQHRY
ncbi:MAG: argininosuccinate synthase [Victivallaceae bacterium]|nr:argininosuccinate synthase [Victivallaceae bacterium]MDD3116402.1 argininosuccinate synthase [Victivallaceae bacterium]MDD3703799.1 argininosuccinate synthase [Victivallaceae bacterium]MDD5662787.1 argininosuccinate synthase [Victivallaceae bacterium]